MQRAIVVITAILAFTLLSSSWVVAVEVKETGEWIVVWDDPAAYGRLQGQEIALEGRLIVENYGKPGERYIRAPLRYWLQTPERRLPLSPPRDSVLMPLDGKTVQIKGKLQTDAGGNETLWVRLIRVSCAREEHPDDRVPGSSQDASPGGSRP